MKKQYSVDLITLIVIGVLAFGLQIPWLGFFQDDWNFVFFSGYKGAQGIFEFLIQDGRPGASWVYILGFSLFRYEPAAWQFFTIVLRILTTIVFWMILNKIWTAHRSSNLVISILFLTYPFFTLQPLSVAYAPHFAAFLLFMLSIYFMVLTFENQNRYLLFSMISVLLTFGHLFTVEYFIGLELLRPVLIWHLLNIQQETTQTEKLKRTLQNWLPYLLIIIFFVYWRSELSSSLGIRNDPIATLFGTDSIILSVAKNAMADLVLMLFSTWSKLVNPDLFVIGPIRNMYILAISIGSGVCYFFLSRHIHVTVAEKKTGARLFTGGMIIVAGMLATYAIGYIIHLKLPPWNSRFSLPALPGFAIVIFTIIDATITSPKIRHIFLSILIGLLIGSHNQNTFNFKTAWEKQERLYQQLTWRAPSIEPGTAIIANEEILPYMGDYPLSFAINTLYRAKPAGEIPYWFFAISENFNYEIDLVFAEDQIQTERALLIFQGNASDAIFITYEPENGQCLWVLRPEEAEYRHLQSNMKIAALTASNRKINEAAGDMSIYDQIVDENRNTWCYYYQKAELARQNNEWSTIVMLWDEAIANDLRPYNGFEFLPFIEAYANLGKWEEAYDLTNRANTKTEAMYFLLCPTWERLAAGTPSNETKIKLVNKANQILKCAVP